MDLRNIYNNNCRNYTIQKSCNEFNINSNNNINGGKRKNGISQWTNERHSKFLSSMEASFVQNMLEKNSNSTNTTKLDRFVPDISESTLDLRTSEHLSNGVTRTCNKQIRTQMVRPRNKMVHDQVVPQLEEKGGGKIEIDLNK